MTTIKSTSAKILFIFIIFTVVHAEKAWAQSRFKTPLSYKGITASFGSRSFDLSSGIKEINQTKVGMGGGQLGIFYGNQAMRANITLFGYYSSASNIKGSIDLYTNGASVNFYPIAALTGKTSKIQPYFSTGVAYEKMKFYGHYLAGPDTKVNYSVTRQPSIGKVNQLNATIGAGVELNVTPGFRNFVHVFTEVKYGAKLFNQGSNSNFASTSSSHQVLMNIGLRFGSRN
jgi:hypothetical protein